MKEMHEHNCAKCRAPRPHYVKTITTRDKRRVRVRVCSVCKTKTGFTPAEAPGVVCVKCGDVRLKCYRVTHTAPGETARVRKCKNCGNQSLAVENRRSGSSSRPVPAPCF